MSRNLLLVAFVLYYVVPAAAQTNTITGRVAESAAGKGLAYATVSLVKAVDSILVGFTIADSSGRFRLSGIPGGNYLLSVSYAGYAPVWKPVPSLAASGVHTMGEIVLTPVGRLRDVNVVGRRPPVEINNDTLEFNSENFRTQPNAVVEELLRKMPGVTIESDGTVKVNGQTVKRVLVNGKEFFTGDVKMATKNLNADAVDKVQVFDRKSDQAGFTGVDDGNSEKTINLKLKKDHNNALFGKVTAGAGIGVPDAGKAGAAMEGRYDAQANINRFRGEEQLSFLAMGNNTNRQGFSLMDVLNFTGDLSRGMRNGGGGIHIQVSDPNNNNGLPVTGMGQNQQGVASTIAGGLNYNNTWDGGRTNLNTNYTMSHIRLLTDKESAVQNLFPGNVYTTWDTAHTVHSVTQERWNIILDQQLDSALSFRLTPSLTWQHTDKNERSSYLSSLADGSLLNNGYNDVRSQPGAFNFATDALIRKKLAKKGRTVSVDWNMAYNHSTSSGSQLADNLFYTRGAVTDSVVNQFSTRNAITRSFGGNITYTEPIGRRSLLAVSGFFNSNSGRSDKQTFDADPVTGKHDRMDSLLSNDFNSDYRYSGGGLSFRSNQRKLNITAGATVQAATLSAMDNSMTIRQSFTDVLPNAILQYAFTQAKNLRLDYSTYTTQPSVVQLQPVADLSDPLNIRTGNPGLKRTYSHRVSLSFIAASPGRRTDFLSMLSYSESANAIVESDSVNPAGAKVITPVNADGVRNLLADINCGFPLRKLSSRIQAGSFFSYAQNISFLNGARNRISSTTIGPNLSFMFNRDDKIDVEVTASVSLNIGSYSLQPALNTHYMRQNYGVNTTWYLPLRFSLHNEFNYIFNTGRANGYNTSVPLWNASLAKNCLKNDRGEIKFGVMDLLDRNMGNTRSINQGNIVDEQYNVLQRYFLLSFTYSLNKSGLRSKGGPNLRIRTIGQ